VGIIAWIIFGAIAGWIASIIAGTNARQGALLNIIVGIVGSFIGGFLYSLLTGNAVDFGFNIGSFVVAVLGAVIFLAILTGFNRSRV